MPTAEGTRLDPDQRRALRAALTATAPWLTDPDHGPRSVAAGACDRCHDAPRLLATCGPVSAEAVCRGCALELGTDGWCDGHLAEGRAARAWAAALPDRWADLVVLWWVSTGEIRTPPSELAAERLPIEVQRTLST